MPGNRVDTRQSACSVLSRKQGVGETEIAQVADPHRIQDAVQVIDLVLHHAGMETAHAAVDRPPVASNPW